MCWMWAGNKRPQLLSCLEMAVFQHSTERRRRFRGLPFLDGVIQDIRFALRALWRSRGFTAVAIATLAVGIGLNAAVFTVTKAALFDGFPMVQGNDRLLYISNGRG